MPPSSATSTSDPVAPARLPTLGAAATGAAAAGRRFPLVIAAGMVAALAAILGADGVGSDALHARLLTAAVLLLPLGIAARLLGERAGGRSWRFAPDAAALAVAVAWYAWWPRLSDELQALRFAQLLVAALLLATFAGVAGRGGRLTFWHFNRILLDRIVAAGALAIILFAGLALALAAADNLFGVPVADEGYARLWFIAVFVFGTWFIAAGVPRDMQRLDEAVPSLPALAALARYVMVPLVSMYLVILTLYLGKVLVTWDWPSGWIGWLVTGVAAAGIGTQLLVQPIAADPAQRWVRVFARDFWLALLPSVAMLWLALYQRIAQYGFTEARYFLAALSLWLFGTALYFRFRSGARLIMIPVSLFALAVLGFVGPWGAYAVAERSQAGRVADLLERHGVRTADGLVAPPARPVAAADAREIAGAVRYLVSRHGTGALQRLLPETARRRAGDPRQGDERTVRVVLAGWGVPYVTRGAGGPPGSRFEVSSQPFGVAVPLAGYDLLITIRPPAPGAVPDSLWSAALAPGGRAIRVARGGTAIIDVPLDSLLGRAQSLAGPRRWNQLPPDLLRADAATRGVIASARLTSLEVLTTAAGYVASEVRGFVLVGVGGRQSR